MDENARLVLASELLGLIQVRDVAVRLKLEAAIQGLAEGKGSDAIPFGVRSQTAEFWLDVDLFDSKTRVLVDGKALKMQSAQDVQMFVVRLKRDYYLRWYI